MTFIQHADSGDENDSTRDDLCPSCGGYLPRHHIGISGTRHAWIRYACGDCLGGTDDPHDLAVPFARNH